MSVPPLIRALKGERIDPVPVWLMRQAGRYLPEYRATRAKANGFLDFCLTPKLAIEATLQPIDRFGMDAAILFADLPLPALGLGRALDYREGEGPVLEPLTDLEAVKKLDLGGVRRVLAPVFETVAGVRARLPREVALIGFAGAPWTLACYMVQGRGSPEFPIPRRWAWRDQEGFAALIDCLTDATIDYLRAQIEAGADAVQLFDSWAGLLPETQFRRWCVEPVQKIRAALAQHHPGVPVIGFPRGAGQFYQGYAAATGVDAVAIDQTVPPQWAAAWIQPMACVQGNLDPQLLVAGGSAMAAEIARIRNALAGGAHVFNLGHGIVPETPPEHVAALVKELRR